MEVYRTVDQIEIAFVNRASEQRDMGLEPDTCLFRDIVILPQNDAIEKMVQIPIPEDAATTKSLASGKTLR